MHVPEPSAVCRGGTGERMNSPVKAKALGNREAAQVLKQEALREIGRLRMGVVAVWGAGTLSSGPGPL